MDGHYETVSLELEVDGCRIRDDSTFDQSDLFEKSQREPERTKVLLPVTGAVYGCI